MTCRPASSRTKRQCSPFALMIYRAIVSAALNQKRCEPANKTPDHFISSNQLIGFSATPANYFLAVRCTREKKKVPEWIHIHGCRAPRGVWIWTKLIFLHVSLREKHMAERRSFIIAGLPLLLSSLSSGRFLNHVLQGHIERYVYIYIHSQVRRGSRSRALFLSPFFLRWVSQTNAGWQATNKET